MTITIDAGHGGTDPGAEIWYSSSPFDARLPYREKDFNLAVAKLLEDELLQLGHVVHMTRRLDHEMSLGARAAISNAAESDVFVSLHANGAAVPHAEGIETFHYPGSDSGRLLASDIQSNLMSEFTDHRNRGVKEANFAVLRLTDCTAVLVEFEFITNPDQVDFLFDESNQHTMAHAVAQAIHAFDD